MTSRASLQTRLLAVTLPLTVGVVMAIAVSSYLIARSVVLHQLERDVVRTNEIAATEARAALEQSRSDAYTIASSPLFRDHYLNVEYGLSQEAAVYRREIERMLAAFSGRTKLFTSVVYADARGRALVRVEEGAPAKGGVLEPVLEARLRELPAGKLYVSDPQPRSGRTDQVLVLGTSLRDESGAVRGFLSFEYSLERLSGLLERLAIGRTGRSALVADGGEAWKGTRLVGEDVVARASIPGTRWAISTSVGRGEFLAPLRWIGTLTLALGVLACFLISSAIAVQVRASVRPIGAVARVAASYAAGDLSARVEAEGPQEVAVLSDAFNTMAERLERRTQDLVLRVRELTSVHKLNEAALANLGRHAVARACLEAALSGLAARRGALFRVDGEELVLEAGGDGERSEAAGRRVLVGDSPSAQRALASGEVVSAEEERRLIPSGSGRIMCAPLLSRGRPTHLLCLDVSDEGPERVRSFSLFCGAAGVALANSELLESTVASEARYRTAIENSPHAVVSLDQHRRVTLWNRRAEALFGWQPTEAYGRTLEFVLEPEDYAALVRKVETDGAAREAPARGLARDGRKLAVTVSWTGQAASERGGREWFVVIQDETEKRRLQAQLLHAEKLSAVGTLIAGIAHELNNPLATIVGFAEILQNLPATPTQREDLKHLYGNALRCRDIVRGLLSFVRRSTPRRVRADLGEIVERSLELVEYRLVRTDGVELEVDRASVALPVSVDPGRLEQVVVNLLGNACDALRGWSGRRRVVVRTRLSADGPTLEVEDSGPGVPSEHRDRLFEPFFTTKPLGIGTGLGLAISSQIVAENGGRVAYEDAPGGGARFVVSFPASTQAPEAPAVEPFSSARAAAKVLVVDDEAAVAALMRRLLAAEGDEVRIETSFEGARARLASERFDLLVLDADLGPRKGWELLDALGDSAPPVVIVSGDVLNKELSERFARLDVPVLAKPFLRSEFLRAVRTALVASA